MKTGMYRKVHVRHSWKGKLFEPSHQEVKPRTEKCRHFAHL